MTRAIIFHLRGVRGARPKNVLIAMGAKGHRT